MKSDIYKLTKFQEDFCGIPAEAEKVGRYNQLDGKSVLRLRLLAEELICLLPQLLIYGSGKFWIENTGKDYELHIEVTPEDKDIDIDKVLSVSSSGKNAAAKGLVGRITAAVEQMMNTRAKLQQSDPYGVWTTGLCDFEEGMIWTLSAYRNGFGDEQTKADNAEEWDELEKSIIANIADDVVVGVLGGKVDIVVKKAF